MLLYVILVWVLVNFIWKRIRLYHSRKLNPEKDYYTIQRDLFTLDFPFLSKNALEFGLFRTYGIPSISHILHKTQEFEKDCSKRYQDTELILSEIQENFGTSREDLAIKRLNYIHSMYKIQPKDYLYTLSVFILEPIRWINKYGYRKAEKHEIESNFLFYKNLGKKMKIENIPNSYEEMDKWNKKFENDYMNFNQSNNDIGEATMKLLASKLPQFCYPVVKGAARSLMDDRLLESMNYVKPSWTLKLLSHYTLKMSSWIILIFLPPRIDYFRGNQITQPSNSGLFLQKNVKFIDHYKSGYKIEELGPKCAKNFILE
eukprot:gene5866-9694_t